jgi:hypothetical protein
MWIFALTVQGLCVKLVAVYKQQIQIVFTYVFSPPAKNSNTPILSTAIVLQRYSTCNYFL